MYVRFVDPVSTIDGQSYERSAIQGLFEILCFVIVFYFVFFFEKSGLLGATAPVPQLDCIFQTLFSFRITPFAVSLICCAGFILDAFTLFVVFFLSF
jgi:hypothetical protein